MSDRLREIKERWNSANELGEALPLAPQDVAYLLAEVRELQERIEDLKMELTEIREELWDARNV